MSFWLTTVAGAIAAGGAVMFAREISEIWDTEPVAWRVFHIAVFTWFLAVVGMFGYFSTSLPS